MSVVDLLMALLDLTLAGACRRAMEVCGDVAVALPQKIEFVVAHYVWWLLDCTCDLTAFTPIQVIFIVFLHTWQQASRLLPTTALSQSLNLEFSNQRSKNLHLKYYKIHFPRSQSNRASVECSGQTSPIHGGPTLQLRGLKGSVGNILVQDTTAHIQGLVDSFTAWKFGFSSVCCTVDCCGSSGIWLHTAICRQHQKLPWIFGNWHGPCLAVVSPWPPSPNSMGGFNM